MAVIALGERTGASGSSNTARKCSVPPLLRLIPAGRCWLLLLVMMIGGTRTRVPR
ncbi:hypothetical protein RchiOBHm_Chr2g0128361 [Rosa chinensis]|uniref:Uncharacterized protein n=1 Tax=Rosa chinensis TaxID=74649 RepID=A0A2P6RUA6_ROSCH|nr:hypothetical protein RchiOBHm_Chr2g0128361 [Rosa chinensis]